MIEAIILGIIQGLTEFLPISSTAHLTLAGYFFGLIDMNHPERWTAYMAVVQLGTALAVLLYFRNDLKGILFSFWSDAVQSRRQFSQWHPDARLGWWMILGSIPIGIVGLLFRDFIEGEFTKDPLVIASALIGFALLLGVAEITSRKAKSIEDITAPIALLVGITQVFALIPGASRSGTTITGGLFAGLRRDVAAHFSFLMSIPAVCASGFLEFTHILKNFPEDALLNVIIATAAAALSGYAAIAFLLRFLRTHSTAVFIVYRILLGIIIVIFLM